MLVMKPLTKFSGMRFLLIIVLVMGICFRFTNLGTKVYWYDEGFTSLRIAGFTEATAVETLRQAGETTVAAIQQFQTIKPGSTFRHTLQSLAAEDPQHPPLFYTLARFWAQVFGTNIEVIRGFAAIASLLALPAMFWFCRELFVETGVFQTNLVSWVGVAVIAVSPLHLLYAQEARQYGLWTGLILLGNATLLYALRQRTIASWVAYGIAMAVGFYTFLFTGLLAIAHAIYVFAGGRLHPRRVHLSFGMALLSSIGVALPWFAVVWRQLQQIHTVTGWTTAAQPLTGLLRNWFKAHSRLIFDTEIRFVDAAVQCLVLLLLVYAIFHLGRHTPRQVWLFVVAPMAVTAIGLMLPDLLLGGMRTIPRYILPYLLSLQGAIAYLLTWKLTHTPPSIAGKQWFLPFLPVQNQGNLILGFVLLCGIISSSLIVQAPTWWVKSHNREMPAIAQTIQAAQNPLVISDAELGDLLSLSHALDPTIPVLLQPRCYTCGLPDPHLSTLTDFLVSDRPAEKITNQTLFFYHPRGHDDWTHEFQQQFENHPHVQPKVLVMEGQDPSLWQLVPKPS